MMELFAGSMVLCWLAAMVVFLVVEGIVPGLVSIWFAVGSLAAMISALLSAPLWLQIALFLVVSLAALLLTRPLAYKYVNSKVSPTNADMVLDQECLVKETVDNLAGTGCVSLQGKDWSARSADGAIIEKGNLVRILRIEGVKVIVVPASGKSGEEVREP